MPHFGLIVDPAINAQDFFKGVQERSARVSYATQPYNIRMNTLNRNGLLYVLFSINPIYPPVYWVGLVIALAGLLFSWVWLTIAGSLLFLLLLPFWTQWVYVLGIWIGLHKRGYHGRFKLMNRVHMIGMLLDEKDTHKHR